MNIGDRVETLDTDARNFGRVIAPPPLLDGSPRYVPPGITWVEFEDGHTAPWDNDQLRPAPVVTSAPTLDDALVQALNHPGTWVGIEDPKDPR